MNFDNTDKIAQIQQRLSDDRWLCMLYNTSLTRPCKAQLIAAEHRT